MFKYKLIVKNAENILSLIEIKIKCSYLPNSYYDHAWKINIINAVLTNLKSTLSNDQTLDSCVKFVCFIGSFMFIILSSRMNLFIKLKAYI
jgi:hypothetical protein